MDTRLKDIVAIFPLLTLVVYSLGLEVVSGYLSQYGLTNDDLINATILKAAFCFLLLLGPILIVLYLNIDKPTDNFHLAKKYFPFLLINVSTYLLFVSFFLIDFKKLAQWEALTFLVGLTTDAFTFFLATSLLFKDKPLRTKILIQLIIPALFLPYLSFRFSYMLGLYFIILFTSLLFVLMLGLVADRKVSWGHFSVHIFLLLFVSFYFGRNVFGNIPNQFGGAAPIHTTVLAKPEKMAFLKTVGFTNADTVSSKVDLLYVSGDKYLLNTGKRTFFLSKDIFDGFIPEN